MKWCRTVAERTDGDQKEAQLLPTETECLKCIVGKQTEISKVDGKGVWNRIHGDAQRVSHFLKGGMMKEWDRPVPPRPTKYSMLGQRTHIKATSSLLSIPIYFKSGVWQ